MKTLKKIFKWVGIIFLIFFATGITLYFIYLRPVMEKMKKTEVVQYDKDLTLVLGGGGNSGILLSDSLVIVIDTKMDEAAEALYKRVKELAGDKPILVINTHLHSDHTKGNKYYEGHNILAGGNYTKEMWMEEASEDVLPTQWLKSKMDIKMGDDTATIFTLNYNAHTASDVLVYLHKRKLLFGGDVILNKQAPAMMGVADPAGYMKAFDELPRQFEIVTIVPGHGPVGGMEILENFRNYFIDMQTAAKNESQEDELVAKYDDWTQVPFLMSTGATIRAIKNKDSRE